MKILKTNWINVLSVFVAVFIYAIILNIVEVDVSRNFLQSILAALILTCLYGVMFWGLFAILLLVVDLVLIARNRKNLKIKLLLEWLIISSPFIYWTVRYNEWIFLVAIIAFLISQLIREKLINKASDTLNSL